MLIPYFFYSVLLVFLLDSPGRQKKGENVHGIFKRFKTVTEDYKFYFYSFFVVNFFIFFFWGGGGSWS